MYRRPDGRIAAAVLVAIAFAAVIAIWSHLRREPGVSDLIDAIRWNEPEQASALIASGVGRERYFDDTLDLNGWYFPIHAAAHFARFTALNQLIEAGADPDQVDYSGKTPLIWLVGGGNAELEGRVACLRRLVEAGANLEAKYGRLDETALHKAAGHGNSTLVRELIALGAQVNARRADGNTPLHQACLDTLYDPERTVRILLAAGADPTLSNDASKTPRDLALEQGRTELAELLSQVGQAVRVP